MENSYFIHIKKSVLKSRIVLLVLFTTLYSPTIASNSNRFQSDKNTFVEEKNDGDSICVVKRQGIVNHNSDISYALEGNFPGIYVKKTSSTFGTAPVINIRGRASFIGNGRPLWIIDGVKHSDLINFNLSELNNGNLTDVFSSSVAGINPEDIESIEVLKDIAATAVYGSDGANGVILVTTKQGKLRINYTGSLTFNHKPKAADFNILDSKSEMEIYRELESKGWLSHTDLPLASEYGVYGKLYEAILTFDDTSFSVDNTPEARGEFLERYANANTDWFDELFKNNITQQHSIDLSGGNDETSFYTSFSHYNDNGFALGYGAERNTINANIQHKFNNKFKVGAKLMANWRDQQTPGVNDAEYSSLDGMYYRNFESNPFKYALTTSRSMRARDENGELEYFRRNYAPFNIINEIENNYVDISVKDISAQVNLDYKFNEKINFHSDVQYRNTKANSDHIIREDSNIPEAYRADDRYEIVKRNPFLFKDPNYPDSPPYSILPEGGFLNKYEHLLEHLYVRNVIHWNPNLKNNQQFFFLIGNEIDNTTREYKSEKIIGILFDEGGKIVHHPNLDQYLEMNGIGLHSYTKKTNKMLSFFADINYSLNSKYIFHGSLRYDESDYPYIEDKALPSWQLSAKWKMKEEVFLKKSSIINYLSPKLSYGRTHLLPGRLNSDYIGFNQKFTAEKINEFNLALEFGLFANRLNGDIAFYKRKSDDLLDIYHTSGIGGMSLQYANNGSMKSRGIEINLNSTNLKTKNFLWISNLNINLYKSEVNSTNNSVTIAEATSYGASLKGKAHKALCSVKFAGLDQNGLPTFFGPNDEIINYLNLNNRNIESVLKYEGPLDPKVYGGFTNNFRYKNFNLNIGLTYAFGNVIRLNSNYKARYNDTESFQNSFKDRWIKEGDEEDTNRPAIVSKRMYSNTSQYAYDLYNLSTETVAKGDFIRLNNINLTYQLPKNIIEKLTLKSASLSVQANNICLLYSDSKLKGIDPEYAPVGGVSLPVPKSYTFTLKLGF